jgi:anaerobic selenocysteine-containing dehydrogenase
VLASRPTNGGPIDWELMGDCKRIREAIGRVIPGLEKMATIDETKQEFHIGGRVFHEQRFATPDGKARLHVHELPEIFITDGELRLMTVRSEGQFNTVVYEDYDLYRGQDRRDVILLHPRDIERLGLAPEQRVTVSTTTGKLENILVREYPHIKPGNALMYYPEANVLVPRNVDSQSHTPAFKSVVVKVDAASRGVMPQPNSD